MGVGTKTFFLFNTGINSPTSVFSQSGLVLPNYFCRFSLPGICSELCFFFSFFFCFHVVLGHGEFVTVLLNASCIKDSSSFKSFLEKKKKNKKGFTVLITLQFN